MDPEATFGAQSHSSEIILLISKSVHYKISISMILSTLRFLYHLNIRVLIEVQVSQLCVTLK